MNWKLILLFGGLLMAKSVPAAPLHVYAVQAISNVQHEFMPYRQGNEPPATLYLRGCRGERLNAAFYISACGEAKKLMVKVDQPQWDKHCDLRWVTRWWQAGRVSFESGRPQFVDELLLHNGNLVESNPFEVKNTYPEVPLDAETLQPLDITCVPTPGILIGTEQGVMLTLIVPADKESGEYDFKLRVSAEGEKPVTVPVHLTVYPFDLPKPSVDYSMYYRARFSKDPEADSQNVNPEFRTDEQMLADLKNMVAHGCANPRAYIGGSEISRLLELRKQAGCDNTHLFLSVTCGPRVFKDDFDRSTFEQLKIHFEEVARQALAQAEGYDVGTIYGYGKDEAKAATLHKQFPLWEGLRNGGVKISSALSGMSEKDLLTIKEFLPDVIMRAGTWPTQKTTEILNARGIRTYVYGHPGPSENPEGFRRTMGILLHNRPWIAGSMEYALMHVWTGNEHPWDDFFGGSHPPSQYRSLMLVYPTSKGVVDTLQWEGFSEGVNDGRYLQLLKSLKSGRTDVKKFLQRVLDEEDTIDMYEMRYQAASLIIQIQEARK